MVPLQPNGSPVRVGRITLRTPGLQGLVTSSRMDAMETRGSVHATELLELVLKSQQIATQDTVVISGTREVPAGGLATRSTHIGEPAIVVEVPEPGENFGQFVLYTDESGVTFWSFARDKDHLIDTARGSGTHTYVLPRTVVPAEGNPKNRGLIRAVGKKVIKVLVFPLVDPILGRVGDLYVQRWERKNRDCRLRLVTPTQYQLNDVESLLTGEWRTLSSGRALLMVHGTFSRTDSAFSQMPRDFVAALCDKYGGRVFGFDHFTLSEDPFKNVEWFLKQVPHEIGLDLDIVCHSRGGLVSRVLAERATAMGLHNVRVHKIVFVGAPNRGTILTDAEYMDNFLDSYLNILNFFFDLIPETAVLEALDAIITVAKQLSLSTLKGLDGLEAMQPEGRFLTELNQGIKDDKKYFSISSDFKPPEQSGLKAHIANRLMDKIFKAENDLVVPTASSYGPNGSGFFPISDRYIFSSSETVHHCSYFAQKRARENILEWLR